MKSLLKYTVWASDAIPLDEWKYRNLTRVVFPVIYAALFFGGISAANLGIPAINEFFPKMATPIFAYAILFTSLISLVGVVLPKQWRLEMAGDVSLFGLLVAYLCSLGILMVSGEGNRGFLVFIVLAAIVPIIWRLTILGAEWQTLRLEDPTIDQGKGE